MGSLKELDFEVFMVSSPCLEELLWPISEESSAPIMAVTPSTRRTRKAKVLLIRDHSVDCQQSTLYPPT